MKFSVFLKFTFFMTILALVYIHMQMQIIDLAYQAKAKENKIRKLVEDNGNVTYTILTLKSSQNLGIKMLAENSNMQFVDPNNIVRISTPQTVSKQAKSTVKPKTQISFQKKSFSNTSLVKAEHKR